MTSQHDDHGRYRLQEILGRGGMGEVHRAYDTRLGRPVAIKFLTSGVVEGGDRDRFTREARLAARLTHPNIVAIYDAGEWDNRPYIVLELVDGTTLADDLAARGPLPVEEVADAALQVADGLSAAHEIGVVHRDVKPGNLIRDNAGRIKILDFGVARLLDERATRLTRAGLLVGTAAYSAPEQITVGEADARSDLYALGCVLYELATGRSPFEGDLAAVAYGHVHRPPTPASELRPDLLGELDSLISVLLAKDPGARPGAAGDVADWLRWPGGSVETLVGPGTAGAAAAAAPADPTQPITPTAQQTPGEPPLLPMDAPARPTTPMPRQTSIAPSSLAAADPPADEAAGADTAPAGPAGGKSSNRAPRRKRRIGLAAGGVGAALLVLLGGYVLGDQAGNDGSSDSPAVADSPAPEPTDPEPTKERTPTPERHPGGGAGGTEGEWLGDLEKRLEDLQDAGRIDSGLADEVRDSIEEARKQYEQARPEKAREQIDKMRNRLEQQLEEKADQWTSDLLENLPVPR